MRNELCDANWSLAADKPPTWSSSPAISASWRWSRCRTRMQDALHQLRRRRAEHGFGRRRAWRSEGLEAWTYTIAPFCYARAFEQIRNDVCLHALPVKLLANGGGYGYGVMGPTHHALEDYGILLTLPNLQRFRSGL